MPRTVGFGLRLYVLAAVLTPLVALFEPVPPGGKTGAAGLLAVMLPVLALKAFLVYKSFTRRGWARIALAAFTWLGIAAYVPGLVNTLRTEPGVGAVDVLLVAMEAVAVVLLFARDSNRWYREAVATGG